MLYFTPLVCGIYIKLYISFIISSHLSHTVITYLTQYMQSVTSGI